jgi:hypothetical protein
MARRYVPARGDIVWITLNPQAGHEQAGSHPALLDEELKKSNSVLTPFFGSLATAMTPQEDQKTVTTIILSHIVA